MKGMLWVVMLSLFGCDVKENEVRSVVTKVQTTPEVVKMIEKFNSQVNQLELNGCEFIYNGKLFSLGMSVRELNRVLGEYDYFNRGYYVWEDLGVVLVDEITESENLDDRLNILKVYFHSNPDPRDLDDLRHELSTKKDIFLLDGIPLDDESSIQDLIDRSIYDYDDFGVSDRGYNIVKDCDASNQKVRYFFSVEGGWDYGGGGHLRYKTDINKDNDNVIRYIGVEYL